MASRHLIAGSRASGHPLLSSRATAVICTAGAASSSWQVRKRLYAKPVNSGSSVDAFLGVSTPAPPREAEDSDLSQNDSSSPGSSRRRRQEGDMSAADELAEILKGGRGSSSNGPLGRSANGRPFTREGMSEVRRSAILAQLKGTAVSADQREGASSTSQQQQEQMPFRKPGPPPPPVPEAEPDPVDREHPHAIDAMHGRNELDERIYQAARAVHHARLHNTTVWPGDPKPLNFAELHAQFEQRAYHQLGIELAYEPTPSSARRTPLTSAVASDEELQAARDDGVLLIAHVSGVLSSEAESQSEEQLRGTESISICSGFAVDGGARMSPDDNGAGTGALVVSCAHTLRSSATRLAKRCSAMPDRKKGAVEHDSVAFAVTRSGSVYPIVNLVSSLPSSDLVLYQLAEYPLDAMTFEEDVEEGEVKSEDAKADKESLQSTMAVSSSSSGDTGIRTLPISPYPATVGTELAVSSSWGFEDDSGAMLPAWFFDGEAVESGASSSGLAVDPSPPEPPLGRERATLSRERDDALRSRWGRARLVAYKTPLGEEAHTGTYDALHSAEFKLLPHSPHNPPALHNWASTAEGMDAATAPPSTSQQALFATAAGAGASAPGKRRGTLPSFPPPGSSGGPVVDVETGSVVGVVRGTKMSVVEGKRGDAIPAEKVFEFFALPGLGDPERK